MKRLILFSLIMVTAVFWPAMLFAQNISVQGTVTDQQGEPLIGCTVQLDGSQVGIVTDIDGKFRLQCPEGALLSFSYVGYNTQKVKATKQMKVQLQEDMHVLNEVVAVGYGTMKRSDITGSVVSVKGDDMQQTSAATMDQMIQGRAAGVQMNMNSGAAGASSSVQIRGINSLNSTNEPVYVIDGAIIQSAAGSDVYSNPLADLNPNDVESIEILKDASATAIYGSQAANGVIIVNMKKGKDSAAPHIGFKATLGVDNMPKKLEVMNLREFAQWAYDVRMQEDGIEIERFKDWESLDDGTDWQSAMFRTGVRQDYNVSTRGGSKTVNYSISGGYNSQEGIVINNGFSRISLRGAIDLKPYKWLDAGLTMNYSQTDRNTGMSTWGVTNNALQGLPNFKVKEDDGSWGRSGYDSETRAYQPNPVAIASITQRNNKVASTRSNAYVTVKPWKWMSWRNEITLDVNTDNMRYLLPAYDLGGSKRLYATHETSKTYNHYTSYKSVMNSTWKVKRFHNIGVMLGYEVNSRYQDYLYGKRLYGSSSSLALNSGDASNSENDGYVTTKRFMSYFGRMTYNYKNRYNLTATLRRDGSSLFADGQRWGTFPSAAASWNISNMPFWGELAETVNGLKLRVGYGVVGNANLPDNTYEATFTNLPSNFGMSYLTQNMPNYNGLTWEKTSSWNLGLDLQLFENRIEFILDVYNKNTRDLLLQTALPAYTGTFTGAATPMWANVGRMNNKGIEATLNAHILSKGKLKWKTALTFSMTKNEITELNNANGFIDKTLDFLGSGEVITRTAVGQSVSQFFGQRVLGRINTAADFLRDNGDGTSTVICATPNHRVGSVVSNTASLSTTVGDLLYVDTNNDGIIDENDRTFIGSPLPDFTAGWNNTFSYKRFSLSVFLYASVGGEVVNWSRRMMDEPSTLDGAMSNKYKRVSNYARIAYYNDNENRNNVWNNYVAPGADPTMTRIDKGRSNMNYRMSDRYVEDGSFLRVKNISLSYSFPKKMIKKYYMQQLKAMVNIQNPFTFTKYSGYDPEVGTQNGQYSMSGQGMLLYGVDTGKVPTPKSYVFTLDASF